MNPLNYRNIIQKAPFAFGWHEIITDNKGKPVDYRFLEVNDVFQDVVGIKATELTGRTIREIMPDIDKLKPDWISEFGKVAIEGGLGSFTFHAEKRNRDYQIYVYSYEKYQFSTLFLDITEQKTAERALKYQNSLWELLTHMYGMYFNLPSSAYESTIDTFLRLMAEAVGADRAYIFDYDFDRQICINTYEWCRNGVESQKDNLQEVPLEPIPEWVEPHKRGETMFVQDVSALPDGTLREILESQSILSLITVPLMQASFCIGFVGFDSVLEKHHYSENEQNLLIIFAHMLSTIRQRKSDEEKMVYQSMILDNIHDAVVAVNLDMTIKFVNRGAEKLYGFTAEDVLGKNIDDVLKTEFPPEITTEFSQYLLENLFWKGEVVQKATDGRILQTDLSAAIVKNFDGKPDGFVGIHRDITDRKNAEKMLFDKQRRLSDIIHSTQSGTWEWNIQTDIVICNERWAEIIGYHLSELEPLTAEKWGTFLHPDDIDNTRQLIIKVHNREIEYYESEYRMKHKDGQWIWIISRGKVLEWSPDGKPLWMYGTHHDNSQSKKMQQELVLAKEKAEQSNLLKSHFLANMSHEIRTPMNGILGFLDLLQDFNLSDKERNHYISVVQQSGQRLLNTINDIIEMSKIESGIVQVEKSVFDLHQVMEYLYHFFKIQTDEKNLELIRIEEVKGDDVRIFTDKFKLEGILTNLIRNAIKFTRQGAIIFGNKMEGDQILFYIRDTGIGIPKESLDAVFERFVQVDLKMLRLNEGTGLGLAISKAYCDMLGGRIWVESTEGKGSTFNVLLPCQKPVE